MLLYHPSIYILAQFHHRLGVRWHWGGAKYHGCRMLCGTFQPVVALQPTVHHPWHPHFTPPPLWLNHITFSRWFAVASTRRRSSIGMGISPSSFPSYACACLVGQFYYNFSGDHGTQNLLLRGWVLQWETRSRVWALVVRRTVNRPKRCQVFILVAVGARRLVKLGVGSGTGTGGYHF